MNRAANPKIETISARVLECCEIHGDGRCTDGPGQGVKSIQHAFCRTEAVFQRGRVENRRSQCTTKDRVQCRLLDREFLA
jgi:hypothetical protein